jgi:hypothetical protein
MMFLWLILAFSMQSPPAVKTKMYSMDEAAGELSSRRATTLRNKLAKLEGVIEAVVLPQEFTVILKIDKLHDWDDAQVLKLLKG